jgi:hypothetical protein
VYIYIYIFKCFDSRFVLYSCCFVFIMYCNNMCGMMGAVRRPAILFFLSVLILGLFFTLAVLYLLCIVTICVE